MRVGPLVASQSAFSAALCRGLIEAGIANSASPMYPHRFPRLYAAASLKPLARGDGPCGAGVGFPRLYAAASLKPRSCCMTSRPRTWFSAALCRGLIEAGVPIGRDLRGELRFPRLYAAASLKPRFRPIVHDAAGEFSAALCRGLIEAILGGRSRTRCRSTFSAALCRGLIEART